MKVQEKRRLREKRHLRVRSKVHGDALKPRLNVFRSVQHIYAQLIDDERGHTLASASTLEAGVKSAGGAGGNIEGAKAVGKLIAARALEQGVTKVVFDRGGYKYHGRVQALADSAREGGLQF